MYSKLEETTRWEAIFYSSLTNREERPEILSQNALWMTYVVSNSTQCQGGKYQWREDMRRWHSCRGGQKESRRHGLLPRDQDHVGSLTRSFAEGASSKHITHGEEKAELPFCISVHKICDKPFNTINISRYVESKAEQLKGVIENRQINCIKVSGAC